MASTCQSHKPVIFDHRLLQKEGNRMIKEKVLNSDSAEERNGI